MKKIYDAVCSNGKYFDANGKEKTRYLNVGAVLEGDKGISLKLEALPIGFNGWVLFFEPKEKDKQQQKLVDDFEEDSEIPF